MSNIDKRTIGVTAALLLGVAATGAAVEAGTNATGSGPARCEIRDTAQGDTIVLEPVIHVGRDLKGSYSISVAGHGSAGTTSIQQGGEFEAHPDRPEILGRLSVAAGGASYDIRLAIGAGGTTTDCVRHVDGAV